MGFWLGWKLILFLMALIFYNKPPILRIIQNEIMSDLKNNYKKWGVCAIGGDEPNVETYVGMFNLQINSFPFKYLGMHVSYVGLKVYDWSFVDIQLLQKSILGLGMACLWKVVLSSLIMSYPTSILYMSVFLMNRTMIKKWDKPRRKFLWQRCGKKRYHLVKWGIICR